MRPVELTMRAFGPYATRQRIDFGLLGDRKLFLISGPTGAGKTSVLDAICYALYGATSGGERVVDEVRCQLADAAEPTQVELVFEKGNDRFRVRRSPLQQRPKKRGPGSTIQAAKAQLERWRPDAGTWEVLAAKSRQVDEGIEAILGFRIDQFRRVVVLPQDQFRRLLTADSAEREQILSNLFATGEYARIQEALKLESKGIKSHIEELERANRQVFEDEGVADRPGLSALERKMGTQLARIDKRIVTLEVKQAKQHAARDAARDLSEKFLERDAAEAALQALDEKQTEIDGQDSDLKRARKAHSLSELAAEVSLRRDEFAEVEQQLATSERALVQAKREAERADRHLKEREAEREKRDLAKREVDDLRALEGDVSVWEQRRADFEQAETEAKTSDERVAALQAGAERAKLALAEKQAEQNQLVESAAEEKNLALQIEQLDQAIVALEKLDQIRASMDTARSAMLTASVEVDEQERLLKDRQRRLESLQAGMIRGQATALASELMPGRPCPVCGSVDHPAPAQTADPTPDSQQLEEVRASVQQSEGLRDAARRKLIDAELSFGKLSSRLEQLREQLGQLGGASVLALERDRIRLAGSLKRAQQAAGRRADLKAELQGCSERLNRQEADLRSANQDVAQKATKLSEARTVLRALEQKVPEEHRELGALQRAIDGAQARADELQAAWEQARKEKVDSDVALAGLAEKTEMSRSEGKRVSKALDTKQNDFTSRLSRAGFTDEGDYLACVLSEGRMAELERLITDQRAKQKAAGERLARVRKAIGRKRPPDLDAKEALLASTRSDLDGLRDEHGQSRVRLEGLCQRRAAVDSRLAEIGALDGEFGIVGELAEVANDRAMTFERWVLAALLDEVLAAASQRLVRMSRSRYLLRRDTDQRDKRRAGGLDLVVFDAHTGAERSVASLSGGEGFLASMSLALGLADVVQAHAGGIRLDTVFIDEGFGSLDPEALDLAYQTLVDIHSEGRLVGVISHVPDLKERIDARLEIKPGTRGASARFVL